MSRTTSPFSTSTTRSAGILDGDADAEVDLASYAYQIWKNAIEADPALEKKISALPSVVYSARAHAPSPLAARMACCSTCARATATTRSPGWMSAANRHPVPACHPPRRRL